MNTEDQQKLEHFISLLRSHVAGEKLQFKYPQGWDSALGGFRHACWEDFNPSNWREEPDAPKVVPWTFETAPPILKARLKGGNEHNVVLSLRGNDGFMALSEEFGGKFVNFPTAANLYVQLDGSPCGIEQKEESEWPKWAEDNEGDIWAGDEEESHFVFVKQRGYKKQEDHRPWANVFRSFMAVEIPAAKAERIMSEAKKGVTK